MPAPLELGHDVLGQDLEVAHHLVVRQVAELHVAQQLIDARLLVAEEPARVTTAIVGSWNDRPTSEAIEVDPTA
jgi:hypothetical protein